MMAGFKIPLLRQMTNEKNSIRGTRVQKILVGFGAEKKMLPNKRNRKLLIRNCFHCTAVHYQKLEILYKSFFKGLSSVFFDT